MAFAQVSWERRRFGQTMRRDLWWVQPLVVFLAAFRIRGVHHVGRVSGHSLLFRSLPFAVLFARDFRRFAARLVWRQAGLVAGVAAVFAGAAYPAVPRAVPASPVTTIAALTTKRSGPIRRPARSASRAKATRRAHLPADPAERPPLFSLPRAPVPRLPGARRVEGAVVYRSGDGRSAVRHRPRHARPGRQRGAARLLHVRLPLAPPPGRRASRSVSKRPIREKRL